MRCPKCGYISFDNQEICKKCNKNIGEAATEVNGTVYDAVPPAFLQLDPIKHFHAQHLPPQDEEINIGRADNEPKISLREGIDTEFVLGNEEITLDDDSIAMHEISSEEDFTLDLNEHTSDLETNFPPLDFGDLDISDLAPPEKEQIAPSPVEEELQLARTEPVAVLSNNAPPQSKTSAAKSKGLEDLQVDGLDLDAPAKLVTGSAAGKRYLPSVKTGTALDNFDIDLGELFAQNKK